MLIEQAFKDFVGQNLKDTKNKKDYDLCIDTYIKTQLVDLSGLNTINAVLDKYGSYQPAPIKDKEEYTGRISFTLPTDLEINLPFNECFIKLADNNADSANVKEIYVFTREFSAMTYTGTIITYFNFGMLKIPFIIVYNRYNQQPILTLDLSILKGYDEDKVINHLIACVIRTFVTLSLLNQKYHNIYKIACGKPEYFRKKTTKYTTKVERPIYIYLDKSKSITRTQNIYPGRKIERLSSWIVRGHWRRLGNPKKRGKDANGKYVVEGFTWVIPHICGNSDNLINKTYIALPGNS